MQANYDMVNRSRFDNDLSNKDGVILLHDKHGIIQGFSTLAWHRALLDGADVVFSGDTIIDREYWGSRELINKFCQLCGCWTTTHNKPLYWFLISKGHRTYQFLPLFSKQWHPMPNQHNTALAEAANQCAQQLFPTAWSAQTGVLHFTSSQGQMKPSLAAATEQRKHNTYVDFFRKRNPGYTEGDELVCLVKMHESNLRGTALRAFRKGINDA
ncbi:MAG: hypothetical protein ACPG32_05690 [Akkermansiaceae bacterium]